METLLPLIIQAIAGAAGGGGMAAMVKRVDLGGTGNLLAGVIGGLAGGQLVNLLGLFSAMTGDPASGLDFGNLIGAAIGGGAGGALLTGLAGLVFGRRRS